jgi:hypothetical protein
MIISVGWERKNISVNKKKRDMKENKLNNIGIALSSNIVGMKV